MMQHKRRLFFDNAQQVSNKRTGRLSHVHLYINIMYVFPPKTGPIVK